MTRPDLAAVAAITLFGAGGGFLLAGTAGLVAGSIAGVAAGVFAIRLRVRPLVATVVAAGAVGGALAGDGIVGALCFPGSCRPLASAAAALTGLGALVGVGLVMALVTRSFDEYRDAVAADRRPPEPGCEGEPTGPGTGS